MRRTALACLGTLALTGAAAAQHKVTFTPEGAGETKAVTEWGTDTAWPSVDNMRQCIAHMGLDEIDVVRVNFYEGEPLQANGELGASSRQKLDNQLSIAALCGDKPIALTPDSATATHASYLNGNQVRIEPWVQLIEATAAYIGKPIHAIEPFNEPDYWPGQGTPQNLRDILDALRTNARFEGVALQAASTLNSDAARAWYDVAGGPATHGTTHQLAGSADAYVRFFQHVEASGDVPYQPELHSLAEAIYGAEYGMGGGIWWGAVQRARGLFVRSCQGKRLGYVEDRGTQSAAAVYRAPDGKLRGFAGCFERAGGLTPYRFVSDRDVYFNGVGPVREYTLTVNQGQDAYVDIELGEDGVSPALDGHRWRIVNVESGLSLEVVSAGTADGADIRVAADQGGDHQRWDIARTRDGYFTLHAAHSGRTAEVADWRTDDGASVRQWGQGDNFLQHWFIEDAGAGAYYLRNAHSTKYMARSGADDVVQETLANTDAQRWRLLAADPAVDGELVAHYAFANNVWDSAGRYDGTLVGEPSYAQGADGDAIALDGDDHLELPIEVANNRDITVAAWVYWEGGGAWQRVFDFGADTQRYMFLTPSSGAETLRFAIKNGGDEQILDTDELPTHTWVHVALTLQGRTGMLYVDGRPRVAGQITIDPAELSATGAYVGASHYPADPPFTGMVDELRIYDHALDARGVLELFDPNASFERDAGVQRDAGVRDAGARPDSAVRDAEIAEGDEAGAGVDEPADEGRKPAAMRSDSAGCSAAGGGQGSAALLLMFYLVVRRRPARA